MSVPPQAPLGDTNLDWLVDIFDVNVVSQHWGQSGPTGDANHDGTVNIFDVNAISAGWDPGLGAYVQANVPFRLDASDQRTVGRLGAAQFDAARSQFLSTPDAAALHFTSGMSVAFWVNLATLGLDRNFVSKWEYPNNGSWTVSSGLHVGQEDELAVWFATGAGGVTGVAITASANLVVERWHHVAVVYDGTLTGDANRVKVYVDGVQQALVFEAGSVPAELPLSTAPLNVGKWGGSLDRYADASLSSLALWSTALNAATVQGLYNQGNGKQYPLLAPAEKVGLVAWWGLEESTGATRMNAVGGGLNLLDTTQVAQRQVVFLWNDVGASALPLTQKFDRRPDYVPGAINGRGAVFFDGINDSLRAAISNFLNTESGNVSFVVRFPLDVSFNFHFHTIFSSSDENGVSQYFFFSAYPTDPVTGEFKSDGVPRFRIRWRLDNMNVSLIGETIIEPGQTYVVSVSSIGAGNPYVMRVNGVEQALFGITGLPWLGSWYADLPGRDNATTGALQRLDGQSDLGRVEIGEIVVLGEEFTTDQVARLERYLADKWRVTLGGASSAEPSISSSSPSPPSPARTFAGPSTAPVAMPQVAGRREVDGGGAPSDVAAMSSSNGILAFAAVTSSNHAAARAEAIDQLIAHDIGDDPDMRLLGPLRERHRARHGHRPSVGVARDAFVHPAAWRAGWYD